MTHKAMLDRPNGSLRAVVRVRFAHNGLKVNLNAAIRKIAQLGDFFVLFSPRQIGQDLVLTGRQHGLGIYTKPKRIKRQRRIIAFSGRGD
jgi:hypothetical protein